MIENPNLVLKGEPYKVAIASHGFSLCDYKPKKWDVLKTYLQETTIFDSPTVKNILWIKTAIAFCVLDIYKVDVFAKALQQDFVKHIVNRKFKSDLFSLQILYQAISVFKPDLQHLLPTREIIETLLESAIYPTETLNLIEALLVKGIGGKQYVKNNLKSKIGHHIGNARKTKITKIY